MQAHQDTNGKFTSNMIGFGLAGNFANHLEQAGEAKDFAHIACDDTNAPKGIFPFYVPIRDTSAVITSSISFLSRYCIDNSAILIPHNTAVQAEPEVALLCEIVYDELDSSAKCAKGRAEKCVSKIVPRYFMACNDTSVRDDSSATKLSQKKNFSAGSKGMGNALAIDTFSSGGVCDNFSIASFIRHKAESNKPANTFAAYGECSVLTTYSYFYTKLLDWIVYKLNTQDDCGVLENLAQILRAANYPTRAVFSIGATRYMPKYEQYRLQEGDEIVIAVFHHHNLSYDKVCNMLDSMPICEITRAFAGDISLLHQVVRIQAPQSH